MRATSATRAPACENACASSRPRPRLAPVITTRFPVDVAAAGERRRGSRSVRSSPSSSSVCTDQYNTLGLHRSDVLDADLLEMHRRMLVIRGFEQRVAALYRDGEVPGFVHLSIGQEASAVGACWPLGPADVITSTHRGHGHCLAKGLDPLGMFAELMAKDAGHEPRPRRFDAHRRSRRSASSAPTASSAAGLPIAVGAATAAQLRADGSVAVAFFGDGAVAQGAFHEAVNLAAVWQLPVIFFCENNGYAEFSPASTQHAAPLEQRAAGYGVDYVAVDGNDVVATAAAMQRRGRRRPRRRRSRHRRGRRPTAGTATTRATRSATGRPRRCGSGRRATRSLVHARRLRAAGVADDDDRVAGSRRSPTSSTPPSRRPGSWPSPSAATLHRLRRPRRGPTRPSRRRRPPTRRCSARWTRSTPRSRPSSRPTSACSSPASTSAPAATCSG